MKVVNFCHAVIASKNERKRVFAWQSTKPTFDNGLPHFALRLVRNDAEFMNFRVNFMNFRLADKEKRAKRVEKFEKFKEFKRVKKSIAKK